jgi:phosphopantetheine--protein transferase-like protein
LETPVLLNPLARASADLDGSYSFPKQLPTSIIHSVKDNSTIASKLLASSDVLSSATKNVHGVGTDVELISSISHENPTFLKRNFTAAELDYCRTASDFRASLAGRWSAKEAVFKSLKVESRGAGASLIDIEIINTTTGPSVVLHGDAKAAADLKGVRSFELSISHSEDCVVAVAISSLA